MDLVTCIDNKDIMKVEELVPLLNSEDESDVNFGVKLAEQLDGIQRSVLRSRIYNFHIGYMEEKKWRSDSYYSDISSIYRIVNGTVYRLNLW